MGGRTSTPVIEIGAEETTRKNKGDVGVSSHPEMTVVARLETASARLGDVIADL